MKAGHPRFFESTKWSGHHPDPIMQVYATTVEVSLSQPDAEDVPSPVVPIDRMTRPNDPEMVTTTNTGMTTNHKALPNMMTADMAVAVNPNTGSDTPLR
jgi:hypothetical protein